MTMFTTQEKKDLKRLLARAVKQDEAMTLESLHGYLYGLAIIPEPIMPREWLWEFFGEMKTLSDQDVDQMFGSLFSAYNRMIEENRQDKLTFPYDLGSLKHKDIQRIRSWAHGFFTATNLRPEVWGMDDDELDDDELYEEGSCEDMLEEADDEDSCDAFQDDEDEIATCFAVVMGVAFPERIPELFPNTDENFFLDDQRAPEFEAKIITMLPEAVTSLREYANATRDDFSDLEDLTADNYPEPTQPPHKVEKIGRNDPCPCGSGLKYKKCCGK